MDNDIKNLALDLGHEDIRERWDNLDGQRQMELDRSRSYAALTIPRVMPPEIFTETSQLDQPYSSLGSRAVTQLASKILSAMIPLNDRPFFRFALKDGIEPDAETFALLEAMSVQVYDRIRQGNLRDVMYQALQSLIITGDCMLMMHNDFHFSMNRIDNYVVLRNADGSIEEVIYVEFQKLSSDELDEQMASSMTMSLDSRRDSNFAMVLCRAVMDDEGNTHVAKFDADTGKVIDHGVYVNSPMIILRWNEIAGEHYGRSMVEDNFGDLQTLEAYTTSMIQSMAAASTFFMGIDPTGTTELTDMAGAQNGDWVAARGSDVEIISPARTMQPQIQAIREAVNDMSNRISRAFLMESGSVRQAERVTATEVRMIGQELENVLGGAFSAIARNLFNPIIKRAVQLMIEDGDLDEGLTAEFSEEGQLSVDIVTGLQALSRDRDLDRLMQLGEVTRNLPPQAIETFKWTAYTQAIIAAMGFDVRNWVHSEEEIEEKKAKAAQEQASAQMQQSVSQAAMQGIAPAIGQEVAGAVGPDVAAAMQQGM